MCCSLQLFHRYQNAFHLFLTYFTISVIFWSCLYLDLFQRILNCKYESWLEIFLSIAQNLHFNAKLSTFFAIKCCYLVNLNHLINLKCKASFWNDEQTAIVAQKKFCKGNFSYCNCPVQFLLLDIAESLCCFWPWNQ